MESEDEREAARRRRRRRARDRHSKSTLKASRRHRKERLQPWFHRWERGAAEAHAAARRKEKRRLRRAMEELRVTHQTQQLTRALGGWQSAVRDVERRRRRRKLAAPDVSASGSELGVIRTRSPNRVVHRSVASALSPQLVRRRAASSDDDLLEVTGGVSMERVASLLSRVAGEVRAERRGIVAGTGEPLADVLEGCAAEAAAACATERQLRSRLSELEEQLSAEARRYQAERAARIAMEAGRDELIAQADDRAADAEALYTMVQGGVELQGEKAEATRTRAARLAAAAERKVGAATRRADELEEKLRLAEMELAKRGGGKDAAKLRSQLEQVRTESLGLRKRLAESEQAGTVLRGEKEALERKLKLSSLSQTAQRHWSEQQQADRSVSGLLGPAGANGSRRGSASSMRTDFSGSAVLSSRPPPPPRQSRSQPEPEPEPEPDPDPDPEPESQPPIVETVLREEARERGFAETEPEREPETEPEPS